MPPHSSARGFNVVLVTFDTTRADHLKLYGRALAPTPTLDALAKNGVTFEEAVVTAPLTLPSHASILTGQYPFRHGVRTNSGYELSAAAESLAEKLHGAGYSTAAFVSCFVLDARFGLNQGFDTYDFGVTEAGRAGPESVFSQRDAKAVTESAIQWLKKDRRTNGDKPFFLWVHYYDPHHPYDAPLTAVTSAAQTPYDAEIAFADEQFGRLVAELRQLNQLHQTLIVFATDHGESLKEHRESGHGIFIYDATMRGAIVFSSSALFDQAYRVRDRLSATIDIAPTILSLLGAPPLGIVDGRDLTTNAIEENRMVLLESYYPKQGRGCAPYFGIRTLRNKYIDAPKPEFYDLISDAGETRNLFTETPVEMLPLENELKELVAAHPAITGTAATRSMSASEEEQLKSLGYVGGEYAEATGPLPDAKDRIELFESNDEAIALVKAGRVEEGLALAIDLMKKTDGFESPVHTVAHIYEGLGRHQEAAALLEEYARRHPSANLFVHLAKVYGELENWNEFERALRAAEVIEPLRGSIFILRGDRFMKVGRFTDAAREYARAVEIDPYRSGPAERAKLASARKLAGQPADAP